MPDDNVVKDEFDQEDDMYGDIDQSEDFLDSDDEENNIKKAESEFDQEEYGKKVQKRINKEVSKRKILEDQNKVLNDRLSSLEDNFNSQENKNNLVDIDSRMKVLKAKRDEMYELGDINGDVEDEYQDLRLEKRDAERNINNHNDEQSVNVRREPAAKNTNTVPDVQQEWLDENEWYSKGDDSTKKANGIFQDLLDEGYNNNHPGMYKEFDKRLSENNDDVINREPGAPPGANPNGGGGKKPVQKSKLTNDDFEMMTEMGMDPRNPNHRKQLLANKRT